MSHQPVSTGHVGLLRLPLTIYASDSHPAIMRRCAIGGTLRGAACSSARGKQANPCNPKVLLYTLNIDSWDAGLQSDAFIGCEVVFNTTVIVQADGAHVGASLCAKISQTWLANVCDMAKVDGITILSLDSRPQDPSLPLSIPGTCILLRLECVLAYAKKD